MKMRVSHSRDAETPEAKARWFQSLPLSDRMELLCAYCDLILSSSPGVLETGNRLQDVFASLEENGVRYLVVGGVAAVLHGVPRATLDLDLLIEATRDNVDRLLAALQDAGLETASLTTPDDLLRNERTVFEDRMRFDVQTERPGVHFEDAWENREEMKYEGQTFYVLSRSDLIASMKASGRDGDREDIRMLETKDGGQGAA